jgi:hypothetical protein
MHEVQSSSYLHISSLLSGSGSAFGCCVGGVSNFLHILVTSMIGQSKENERLPGKWGILYMIFHGMIIKWLIYFCFQDFVKFGKKI